MGDVGDYWREHRDYKFEKKMQREGNECRVQGLNRPMEWRDDRDVARTFFNDDQWADFWPSSGKWLFSDDERGQGFGSMVAGIRRREFQHNKGSKAS